jgi:hypothetical protein
MLWAATAALFNVLPVSVASAKPVEYVKVCSLYGAGYFYIPGTDTCLRVGGIGSFQVGGGNVCNFGPRSFFTEGAACPTRATGARSFQQVERCSQVGAGYYQDRGTYICPKIAGFDLPVTYRPESSTRNSASWGIDLGLSFGFTNFAPNVAYLNGRDTLAVPPNDRRNLDMDRTTGSVGVVVNSWTLAPSFLPLPADSNIFFTTGARFAVGSSQEQTVDGVNVVPDATVTSKVKENWGWAVYAGFSVKSPFELGFLDETRIRLGGGGEFRNRTLSVTGTDTAGPFSASRDVTSFEPGILYGIRGKAGGFIYGLDITNTFPCPESVTAQSIFPSQTYKYRVGGGVNTAVNFSISKQIISGLHYGTAPPPPP